MGQDTQIHTIYFLNNKTEINQKDSKTLDYFLDSIVVSATCKVIVKGFVDNTGNEKHNYSVSDKRTISAKKYLLSKGISSENITTIAASPMVHPNKNKDENERQFNRRVEVIVSCPENTKEAIGA